MYTYPSVDRMKLAEAGNWKGPNQQTYLLRVVIEVMYYKY